MNYWLLKTEPGDYSYVDLEEDQRAVWEGVRNNQALVFLRKIKKGDQAFVYHTGKEKAVVGVADVVREAYPDPDEEDPRFVVVDVSAKKKLKKAVSLAAIKSDPDFADFHLVRISRLSVMPVTSKMWKKILAMSSQ